VFACSLQTVPSFELSSTTNSTELVREPILVHQLDLVLPTRTAGNSRTLSTETPVSIRTFVLEQTLSDPKDSRLSVRILLEIYQLSPLVVASTSTVTVTEMVTSKKVARTMRSRSTTCCKKADFGRKCSCLDLEKVLPNSSSVGGLEREYFLHCIVSSHRA